MKDVASISASLGPAPAGFAPGTQGALGLLLLETLFERLPGDLGRADSWPVPVLSRVVRGAGPADIVRDPVRFDRGTWGLAFAQAARELAGEGVRAITTSCGFLVLLREQLQRASPVPLVTSSLELLPALLAREKRVGVLTIDAGALSDEHLSCAGVPPDRLHDVVLQGVDPQGRFARRLLRQARDVDAVSAGQDVVGAALALRSRAPDLRTLVLECTNMPAHADAVRAATGAAVLSLLDSPVLHAAFIQQDLS